MNKRTLFFICLMSISLGASGQTNPGVGINKTGEQPKISAGLDVNFDSLGILIPRVKLNGTADISTIENPDTSLLVFNTKSTNDIDTGFYYWSGEKWLPIISENNFSDHLYRITGGDQDWMVITPNMYAIPGGTVGIGKTPPHNGKLHLSGIAGVHGLNIENAGMSGIRINNTSSNGIILDGSIGTNGLSMHDIGNHGIYMQDVAGHGVYIDGATNVIAQNGIRINGTNNDGIFLDGAARIINGDGLEINGTNQNGIFINGLAAGITGNGIQINGVYGHGIFIDGATDDIRSDGININGAQHNGIFINGSASNIGAVGLKMNGISGDAILIDGMTAPIGGDGMEVYSVAGHGIHVNGQLGEVGGNGIHSISLGSGHAGYFKTLADSADISTLYVETTVEGGSAASIIGNVFMDGLLDVTKSAFMRENLQVDGTFTVLGKSFLNGGIGGTLVVDNKAMFKNGLEVTEGDLDLLGENSTVRAPNLQAEKSLKVNIGTGYKTTINEDGLRVDDPEDTNAPLKGWFGKVLEQFPGGGLIADLFHLTAEGGKFALVNTESYGRRLLAADESTQLYFFDRGSGELLNGADTIFIDPIYLETICDTCSYLVQITPTADCNGLFVYEKASTYFIIKELMSGISNATFDWEIQALRDKWENVRLLEYTDTP